ncbi:MAG: type IV pilin-like G/H family protein [Sedimentisphaerales bacterium]
MRMPGKNSRAGYTLFEVCVAMIIICILVSICAPIYTKAIEQARLDSAAGNLKTIWAAQRAYWLKNKTFASNLTLLGDENLIGTSLATQSEPNAMYVYDIEDADAISFSASAVRNGSRTWTGQILIDENGRLSGSISKEGSSITLEPLTLE